MKTRTSALTLGMVAIAAYAGFAHTPRKSNVQAAGESDYQYVSKVQVNDDNYGYINVLGNFASLHGCSQPSFAKTQYDVSDKRTDLQLRIAATSFVTRSPVHVWTSGCTPYGYPILTAIQIQETYTPPPACSAGYKSCGNTCIPTAQVCCPSGQRYCPNVGRCAISSQPCPTTP